DVPHQSRPPLPPRYRFHHAGSRESAVFSTISPSHSAIPSSGPNERGLGIEPSSGTVQAPGSRALGSAHELMAIASPVGVKPRIAVLLSPQNVSRVVDPVAESSFMISGARPWTPPKTIDLPSGAIRGFLIGASIDSTRVGADPS